MTNRCLILLTIFTYAHMHIAPFCFTLRYLPRSLPRSHLPRITTNLVHRSRPCYLRSMSSYPATIKAVQVTAHGGPEVLAVGPSIIFSRGVTYGYLLFFS